MMWSLVLADGPSLSFNNGLPGQCPESWQFDNIPVFLVQLHKGFSYQCLWALTVAEYRPVHRWEKGNLTPRLFPSNKEVHQCSAQCNDKGLQSTHVHQRRQQRSRCQCAAVGHWQLQSTVHPIQTKCNHTLHWSYLIHILFSCNSTIDTYQQMTLSIQEVKFWLSSDQVLNLTESHLQFSGRQSIVG